MGLGAGEPVNAVVVVLTLAAGLDSLTVAPDLFRDSRLILADLFGNAGKGILII